MEQVAKDSGIGLSSTLQIVAQALARYLHESRRGEGPVVPLRPIAELGRELGLRHWIASGGMDAAGLEAFVERYLAGTTRMHHPGYLAHQVAVPHDAAALADLIHGVTNNPMAIYEMGPTAVATELAVLDWMLELVGWPPAVWPGDGPNDRPHGAGVLTHGGSLANLTALLAARARAAPDAWDRGVPTDLVVLAPRPAHYSIARAAAILGLGSEALRPVAVDDREVVMPDRLPELYREVTDEGRRVMAVVANACATSTGLFDPLEEVGHFCREHGLWFHVDGAHGASFLASRRERHRLRGVELADSLTWDAHKMLRTSTLCTAVLFRDARACDGAFQEEASYLFYGDNVYGVDLIHRTIECTKAALGLKLFLVLAALGEEGIATYIDEQVDKTRRFAELIAARPGFTCPYTPEANVLCFRYGTDDALQVRIRDVLMQRGQHHLSSTEVSGHRYLRLAVMNPSTDEAHVSALLDAIESAAASPEHRRTKR